MPYSQPAHTTTRRIPRILIAGLLVVTAATTAALGYPLLASSAPRPTSPSDALRSEPRGAAPAAAPDLPDAGDLRDRGLTLLRRLDRFRQSPGRPPRDAAPGPPGDEAPGRPPRDGTPGRPGAPAPGRPDDAPPGPPRAPAPGL